MTSGPVRSLWFLLVAWLTLATAAAQALVPQGSPLAPGRGSAFSFATSDVARTPAAAPAPLRRAKPAEPGGAGQAATTPAAPASLAPGAESPPVSLRAPLPRPSPASAFRSRAPPAA